MLMYYINININSLDITGKSYIYYAIKYNNVYLIKKLIKMGIKIRKNDINDLISIASEYNSRIALDSTGTTHTILNNNDSDSNDSSDSNGIRASNSAR